MPTPLFSRTVVAKTAAERTADQLVRAAQTTYTQLCRAQKETMRAVWANPSGLTPQAVFDALGTSGGRLLAAHSAASDLVITLASMDGVPPDITPLPEGVTLSVDAEGRVLVWA